MLWEDFEQGNKHFEDLAQQKELEVARERGLLAAHLTLLACPAGEGIFGEDTSLHAGSGCDAVR